MRPSITVPDADVEAFYKQNQQQYTTPAQARASHILFKTAGKDEAALRQLLRSLDYDPHRGETYNVVVRLARRLKQPGAVALSGL